MNKLYFILLIIILNPLLINSQIPNYTVQDTNQIEYDIDHFLDAEKHTLIAFWAKWCGPCKYELNSWKNYTENWIQNENINLIAISIDEPSDRAKAINMWDENEWDGILLFSNISISLPKYFLYNSEENLIIQKSGFSSGNEIVLDSIIKQLNITTEIEELTEPSNIEYYKRNNQIILESKIDLQNIKLHQVSIDGRKLHSERFNLFKDVPKSIDLDKRHKLVIVYIEHENEIKNVKLLQTE